MTAKRAPGLCAYCGHKITTRPDGTAYQHNVRRVRLSWLRKPETYATTEVCPGSGQPVDALETR